MTRGQLFCSILALVALLLTVIPAQALAQGDIGSTDTTPAQLGTWLPDWVSSLLSRFGFRHAIHTARESLHPAVEPSRLGAVISPNGGAISDPDADFQPHQRTGVAPSGLGVVLDPSGDALPDPDSDFRPHQTEENVP